MNGQLCLIDTDIFSYILKRCDPAFQRGRDYVKRNRRFTISCFTSYECLRGYKAVGAEKRLLVFREILMLTDVIYPDRVILDKAAEIYSVLKPIGSLTGEFDLHIAATSLVYDSNIVTNNEKHYHTIQKHFPLRIRNWMN